MKTINIEVELSDEEHDVLKAIMALPEKKRNNKFCMSECEVDGIDQMVEYDCEMMYRDVDKLMECGILLKAGHWGDEYRVNPNLKIELCKK